ncbi:unnamed protein product [Strongylus vulgaris]|uniref:Cation-transporting P-type ATPase N-terminal domain-containing protein n=1 Tax=Strongylus vulgaris TaxID=40348 RepID=A0A3P7J4T2_STRVU|nr:unnamed protein product [Strongylus vulgaris]
MRSRYRKLEWKHILVGDFVHLSHDEIIPADILLLRSSDTNGAPLPREFTILAKENVLLRGCVVKNTDFVEGIVLYAGNDTKAMLNNKGPRYKR